MSDPAIKILLVEDNPGDAKLVQAMLASATDGAAEVQRATRLEEAKALLEKDVFDAVILDLGLPDSKGMTTVDQAQMPATNQRIPIVVVTGIVDEHEAVEVLRHGAEDFLLKNNLDPGNLIRTIRFAIERQQLRNRHEDADAQRRHENEMTSLEHISAVSTSLVTARAYGLERLRESAPDTFELLVEQYAELIEQAIEQRSFKVDSKTSQGLRVLAQRLGFLRARPRDVVEIHTAAVKGEISGAQVRRAYVLAEEARLLLIELMGYLAAYYRDHMIPGASSRGGARPRGESDRTEETRK